MKRLFIVVNVDWFFLSHRLPIALEAKKSGYNVTIVTKDTGQSELIKSMGLNFINFPIDRSSTNPVSELKNILFLFKLYKKEKPDLVHHVALKSVTYGAIASRILNIPTVNAVSGLGYSFINNGRIAVAKKITEKFLKFGLGNKKSKLILQNNDDLELFLKRKIISNNSVKIIKGSGVDCEKFSFVKEKINGVFKIVFPARLLIDKGLMEFIGAARIIKERGFKNVEFLLAGDIDTINPAAIKINKLQEYIDRGIVKWLGFVEDMFSLYKESSLVVLPSYREGLPKSLIEAAAVGRAIITTNVPGCREVVIDGVNGYLVTPKSSKELADKIEILIKDDELRMKMGEKSREIALQEFRVEKVVKDTLDIYKELLN